MNLVGYGSESEDSATEEKPQPIKTAAKPAFQKSSSNKVQINLPSVRAEEPLEDVNAAPPAKRLRRGPGDGGGLFSGLNSFLPAPKRNGPASSSAFNDAEGSTVKRTLGRGLGKGVNLKTGAAPGFTREAMPALPSTDDAPFSALQYDEQSTGSAIVEEPEVKTVGQVTMFRPLSVSRKAGAKKKKVAQPVTTPSQSQATTTTIETIRTEVGPSKTTVKPQVSLFSLPTAESHNEAGANRNGGYEPLLVNDHVANVEDDAMVVDVVNDYAPEQPIDLYSNTATSASTGPQSLQTIASDLKLSKAEQRQLFGRNPRDMAGMSATNVVNFNTDTEYAANEEIRAKGETISHQPVRGIAPGKHSLRQLMNTAVTQKDALEESFAQGAKNRKEAGSKYGW